MTVVHGKLALAATLGGVPSLFLCSQFGMGLSPVATQVMHMFHGALTPVACALVCGALFSVLPAVALRVACGPMQYRAITRNHARAVIGWFVLIGIGLSMAGDQSRTLVEVVTWIGAAFAAFQLIAACARSWTSVAVRLQR